MQSYSNRSKSELKKLFIYQRLGLLPNQKNIFLAPACDYNYLFFVKQVISKIDNATLVIFNSSQFHVNLDDLLQNIGNPIYDRFVRHLGDLFTKDLTTLISMSKAIVLPNLSVLDMTYNHFLMNAIMKSKPVVKSGISHSSIPAILKNNNINIADRDYKGWVNILSELITYPEDANDFALMARSRTIEHFSELSVFEQYEIAI